MWPIRLARTVNDVAAVAGGDPPRNEETFPVALPGLAQLRESVARHARACGLPVARVNDLVLIANELTSNVVRHGGGTGRMRLWFDGVAVYCQVSDQGGGIVGADQAGLLRSRPDAVTGRGLWMIRQLGDEVHIETGADGTVVTVAVRLPADVDDAASLPA